MSWILILALVIIAVAVLVALKGKQGGTGTIDAPYQPAKALFTPAERSFLGVLDQAVGLEHRVFGKVRVADLATVKPGLSNAERQGALNRVAAKHIDFIVCRTSDLAVVCAVELNDKSHANQRAQARDDLLSRVCRAINLQLLTFPAKPAYSSQEIRAQFIAVISPLSSATVEARKIR